MLHGIQGRILFKGNIINISYIILESLTWKVIKEGGICQEARKLFIDFMTLTHCYAINRAISQTDRNHLQ